MKVRFESDLNQISLPADEAFPSMSNQDEILTVLVGFRPENYRGDRGKVRNRRWKAQLGAWARGEGWFVREVREALLISPRKSSAG